MEAMLEMFARIGVVLNTHDRIGAGQRARMRYGPCKVNRIGDRQGFYIWPVYHTAPDAWPGDNTVPMPFPWTTGVTIEQLDIVTSG